MDTITLLVNKAKNGDQEAQKELILQMTPLLRKYASKIHFMEFDDSIQELSLSLIECIPYLDPDKGQAKLLKYIQESIIHKYYALWSGRFCNTYKTDACWKQ